MSKKVIASLIPTTVSAATSIASRGYNGIGLGEEFHTNIAPQDAEVSIESLDFDCILNESITRTAKMSDYAIESGSSISDHISIDPIELHLTGKMTSMTDGVVGTAVSNPEKLLGIRSFDDLKKTSYNGSGKIHKAFTTMNKMFEARTPFAIVTGLTIHRGMIITSMTISRDSPLEEYNFDMTLKQLNVTILEWGQIVESKARKQPTKNRGGKPKTKSTSTPKPTTAKYDEKLAIKPKTFSTDSSIATKRSTTSWH